MQDNERIFHIFSHFFFFPAFIIFESLIISRAFWSTEASNLQANANSFHGGRRGQLVKSALRVPWIALWFALWIAREALSSCHRHKAPHVLLQHKGWGTLTAETLQHYKGLAWSFESFALNFALIFHCFSAFFLHRAWLSSPMPSVSAPVTPVGTPLATPRGTPLATPAATPPVPGPGHVREIEMTRWYKLIQDAAETIFSLYVFVCFVCNHHFSFHVELSMCKCLTNSLSCVLVFVAATGIVATPQADGPPWCVCNSVGPTNSQRL